MKCVLNARRLAQPEAFDALDQMGGQAHLVMSYARAFLSSFTFRGSPALTGVLEV